MIVDFHTHIFPEKIAERTLLALQSNSNNTPKTNGTHTGLIQKMEEAGVDLSIALPVLTKPTQFESVMNYAKEINELYSDKSRRIISFCGFHPDIENAKDKLKLVKENGFLGIKIHPDFQNTFIDDDKYINILKICKDLDLICVTHSGVDDGYKDCPVRCTPDRVLKVINKVNHDKFVLAHYGAHREWNETLDILAGKNVYFDTAFTLDHIDKDLFNKILDKHGDNKVLFATDSPWDDIKKDVELLKTFIDDKEVLDKIFYKNAIKLLGL
ncbi:MAG: amidohydrolase family protein [Firmicutes bacterium]|nr:amidohydrolase family protein [Candidatus Caballimonas caccae]